MLQERGQITLPKRLREELRLQPGARIEVEVIPGGLLLKKPRAKLELDKWHGYLRSRYKELGFGSVDELVAFVRDRDDPISRAPRTQRRGCRRGGGRWHHRRAGRSAGTTG